MTEIVIKLSNGTGENVTGQKGEKMLNRFYFLQLFADGGEGGGAAGDPSGNASGGTGDGAGTSSTQLPDFDDYLAQGGQAEFDRRVQKAIQTAVSNAQKKWQTMTDGKVSEAEKLAQMTNEEKAEYRAKKAEEELASLKKQMALGDMAKTARKMLADEQISVPDEIINNLISDDAESTKSAVESFAKIFKEAVQAGIKEALRGNPPKASTGSGSGAITRQQILAIKNREERQRMIAENPELFTRK